MKTKKQKAEVIKDLSKKIPEADMIVFTSFSREGEKGLSVAKMQELKRGLKKQGGEYLVAKKNLIKISAEQTKLSKMVEVDSFAGSLGVVLGAKGADGIALSRNIYEFSRANPVFKVLGVVFENQYLDSASFVALAKLPPKEVLLSRMVGMMKYPLTGLVSTLQGNIRNLVVVLGNIKK